MSSPCAALVKGMYETHKEAASWAGTGTGMGVGAGVWVSIVLCQRLLLRVGFCWPGLKLWGQPSQALYRPSRTQANLLAFGRLWPSLGFHKAEAGPLGRGFFCLLIVTGSHALHKSASKSKSTLAFRVLFSMFMPFKARWHPRYVVCTPSPSTTSVSNHLNPHLQQWHPTIAPNASVVRWGFQCPCCWWHSRYVMLSLDSNSLTLDTGSDMSFQNGRFPPFIEGLTVSMSIQHSASPWSCLHWLHCLSSVPILRPTSLPVWGTTHPWHVLFWLNPNDIPLTQWQLLQGAGQFGGMLVTSALPLNIPMVILKVSGMVPAKQILALTTSNLFSKVEVLTAKVKHYVLDEMQMPLALLTIRMIPESSGRRCTSSVMLSPWPPSFKSQHWWFMWSKMWQHISDFFKAKVHNSQHALKIQQRGLLNLSMGGPVTVKLQGPLWSEMLTWELSGRYLLVGGKRKEGHTKVWVCRRWLERKDGK